MEQVTSQQGVNIGKPFWDGGDIGRSAGSFLCLSELTGFHARICLLSLFLVKLNGLGLFVYKTTFKDFTAQLEGQEDK